MSQTQSRVAIGRQVIEPVTQVYLVTPHIQYASYKETQEK